ncbi:hypothetical protein [Leucobacter aridicollis]|uniref:hypothetical protein n=1 Tax=Leucobacter aridicollis TaxID=283878 RepID=UPI0021072F51|nr:hypothetical protein [Leucobacter aridicollis]UTX53388.1 hypothetical protein KI794_01080 [Leucobacter aridicollis]
MSEDLITGFTNPTTPPSSPLDTLKALVLRNIDQLEYVIDQLSGGGYNVPEELIEFIDGIKGSQYEAIGEHVAIGQQQIGPITVPALAPSAYVYDDGSPVVERFTARYGTSVFFPRYGGDREAALARHREWAASMERSYDTETAFGEIIDGIDWGRNGPMDA